MAHTVTLSASMLIQDTSGAAPVTVANDSKTDQLTGQDEFLEMSVTVPAAAVDQTIDLTTPGLSARTLYITTTQPLTMKQGAATFAQPIRSIFVATYEAANVPASLKFSNAGATGAQVKIALGSQN
jgi:hypothetical protein